MIKIEPSAIRETQFHGYAIRFLPGGGITVIAGLIAKAFGPAVGGLFLAFPAILPASVTLVAKHEKEKKNESGLRGHQRGRAAAAVDAAGTVLGSFGLAIFAVINWRLLPSHSTALVLATATLAWFIAASAAWLTWKRRHRLFR